jgi:hypothetical protein
MTAAAVAVPQKLEVESDSVSINKTGRMEIDFCRLCEKRANIPNRSLGFDLLSSH